MNTQENHPKLCECGCGQPAPIAKHTNNKLGYRKGRPMRYVDGHQGRANRRIGCEPPPKPKTRKPPKLRSAKERFWKKVETEAPHECWNWQASTYLNGYGQFWTGTNLVPAHRFAYFLEHGPIPDNHVICHHCDNPLCCNPAHLFLGTQQDNIDDMMSKGRNNQARGERQASAKFTEEQVRQIRQMHATGQYSYSGLARLLGVAMPTIRNIVLRKSWTHI